MAGEIVSGDAAAGGLAIGDKVCALVAGGGYAEYCVAPAAQCLPIPRGLSDIEAAGLPETYFTVWSNVFDRGGLAEGEALLVHGGASGIGTTAIQLARAMGNPVYATVGSDERARAVEALGAARGINYKTQDFVKEVLDATGGRGVDVVLDMVAGDYIGRDIQCLADDGRIVIIAQLGGAHANGHGAGHASPAHHHRFHAASAPRGLQGRHCARCASAPGRCWSRAPSSRSSTPPSRWPRPPRPRHDGKRREHRQDHPDRIGKLGCVGTPAHNRIQSQVSPGIFPGRPVGECFMGLGLP